MNIKLDPGAYMPKRAYELDAGYDLQSRETKVVPAGGSAVFDTGVHVELPTEIELCEELYYHVYQTHKFVCKTTGFIKSKSGMNFKHNITSEGVIDAGYTGSIHVKLYNHGNNDYMVNKGDKIAQLVILPVITPELHLVNELHETERGDSGFGSTGR